MSLVSIKNLSKKFVLPSSLGSSKKIVHAVNDVDLSIYQGEHLGLVGESGSGKSTLARLVVKLYHPTQGQIMIDEHQMTKMSQWRFRKYRKKVQMVFQDPYSSLDPRFTVRAILLEALRLVRKEVPRKKRHQKMVEVLESVGLSENVLLRYPHEFSGGERQRIAIARCLVMKPDLLILDEAVSSLDVLVQAQIIELLKRIESDYHVTFLFITHNLRVVRKLCRQIAVMYQGKIVELASTEELFQNPIHAYTKKLLKAAMEYKSADGIVEKINTENSHLIDQGNGHFVLE